MATGGVLPLDEQVKTTAESPFDDARADFILISSDGVAFYVYSTLLALISPVFEIMFKLPQGRYQDLYKEKSFINVTDEASKLQLLLTWCDPRCPTPSATATLGDLQAVLEIADKYGMDSILKRVDMLLLEQKRFIADVPLRAFCIAIRFRLEAPAKAAAAQAVKVPFSGWERCAEMKHLSAVTYDSLIRYQTSCLNAAKMVTTDLKWLYELRCTMAVSFVASACPTDARGCKVTQRSGSTWLAWFVDYLTLVEDKLNTRLDGAVASEPSLLSEALLILGQDYHCANCQLYGSGALIKISLLVSQEINARISKVNFAIEF